MLRRFLFLSFIGLDSLSLASIPTNCFSILSLISMECLVNNFFFILFRFLIKILLSLGICFFWYTFLGGIYFQHVLSKVANRLITLKYFRVYKKTRIFTNGLGSLIRTYNLIHLTCMIFHMYNNDRNALSVYHKVKFDTIECI